MLGARCGHPEYEWERWWALKATMKRPRVSGEFPGRGRRIVERTRSCSSSKLLVVLTDKNQSRVIACGGPKGSPMRSHSDPQRGESRALAFLADLCGDMFLIFGE